MSNLDNLKTSVAKIKTYIDDKNTARIAAESTLNDGVMTAINNAKTADGKAVTADGKAVTAQAAAVAAQATATSAQSAASAASAANTALNNKVYGSTPTAVKKAIGDGSNNNIIDTYLRKDSHGVGGFAPLDTNSKIPISFLHVGEARGLVPLNSSSKIDVSFLPASIDDIIAMSAIDTTSRSSTAMVTYVNANMLNPNAEHDGTNFTIDQAVTSIYYSTSNNKSYRMADFGTGDDHLYQFVEISASLAIGTSSSSAYKGSDGAANRVSINDNASGIMTLFNTTVQSVEFNFTTSVSTVSASITGSVLTINIPKNLSVYTNNAGFVTAADAATAAQTKVDALSTDVCNAIDYVF